MDKPGQKKLLAKPADKLPALQAEMLDIISSISHSVPRRKTSHRVDISRELPVYCLSISARAEKLLVGSRGSAKIIDLRSGEIEKRFSTDKKVKSAFLDFQGEYLAYAANSSARMWHARRDFSQDFNGHKADINSVTLNIRDTRIFTGSTDHTAKMWDTRSGECLMTYHHRGIVSKAIANLFETRLFTVCADKIARCFDIRSGKCISEYCSLRGIEDLQVSLDSKTLVTSANDAIEVWDVESQKSLKEILCPAPVNAIKLVANGRTAIVGGKDGIARLWDLDRGTCIKTFKAHRQEISAIDLSRDGRLLITASSDCRVCLWDFGTGKHLATFYNLDEGFLWSTPGDKVAPNGWIWTDNEAALEVLESGEDGSDPKELDAMGKREYLSMYQNEQMVINRINDYRKYREMLCEESVEEQSKTLDLQIKREMQIKRLTTGEGLS